MRCPRQRTQFCYRPPDKAHFCCLQARDTSSFFVHAFLRNLSVNVETHKHCQHPRMARTHLHIKGQPAQQTQLVQLMQHVQGQPQRMAHGRMCIPFLLAS